MGTFFSQVIQYVTYYYSVLALWSSWKRYGITALFSLVIILSFWCLLFRHLWTQRTTLLSQVRLYQANSLFSQGAENNSQTPNLTSNQRNILSNILDQERMVLEKTLLSWLSKNAIIIDKISFYKKSNKIAIAVRTSFDQLDAFLRVYKDKRAIVFKGNTLLALLLTYVKLQRSEYSSLIEGIFMFTWCRSTNFVAMPEKESALRKEARNPFVFCKHRASKKRQLLGRGIFHEIVAHDTVYNVVQKERFFDVYKQANGKFTIVLPKSSKKKALQLEKAEGLGGEQYCRTVP